MPVPIRIEIKKKAISQFKKAAKEAFPKETLAYLIGEHVGDLVIIEEVYFPEKVNEASSKNAVYYQEWWPKEAKEYASDNGSNVVGDIHSHPRRFKLWKGLTTEITPSQGDYVDGWSGICGICVVSELKSGKLRAGIKFYGPTSKVIVREI